MLMKRDNRFNTSNNKFIKCTAHTFNCLSTCWGVNNEFSNHTIIKRRDLIAGVKSTINAHTDSTRRMIYGNFSGRWNKSYWIFSVNTAFNSMTRESNIFLCIAEFFASSETNLFMHKVNVADHLCNRVFNL